MRTARPLLLVVIGALLAIVSLGACSSSDDDTTAAPAAFVSPVDHKTYCAWVDNPHECPVGGPPAAPFAMPNTQPDRDQDHLSTGDFLLMMALFNYHTTYAPWYGRPWYYDNYISPAWIHYPGTYYAAPGRTVVKITNVTNYQSSSTSFNRRYAAQEKSSARNASYKTAGGKVYKGTSVPKAAFSGTNVRVDNGVIKSGGSGYKIGKSGSGSGKGTFGGSSSRGSGFSGGRGGRR